MERIRVDFNRRDGNDRLISSASRASAPIAVGDVVEVFQPGEDDMTTFAKVAEVQEDGRTYLEALPAAPEPVRFGKPQSWFHTSRSASIPFPTEVELFAKRELTHQ